MAHLSARDLIPANGIYLVLYQVDRAVDKSDIPEFTPKYFSLKTGFVKPLV